MWSFIVVNVWFISSSIDGFLDFPVYNELRRKFPTPSQLLSRLTTDVISHKVPQFKPSLILGEGRKHLKCKARRENITGEVSTLKVGLKHCILGLLSCLLRICDVKIIILQNCGERKYDTGAGLNDIKH